MAGRDGDEYLLTTYLLVCDDESVHDRPVCVTDCTYMTEIRSRPEEVCRRVVKVGTIAT